jgi:hypothetical protein
VGVFVQLMLPRTSERVFGWIGAGMCMFCSVAFSLCVFLVSIVSGKVHVLRQ